jgi:hypothetical protein
MTARLKPIPNLQTAAEDTAGMALWAALDAEKMPNSNTLAGAALGSLVWQYFGKQRAAAYAHQITGGQVAKALEIAVGLSERAVKIPFTDKTVNVPTIDPEKASGTQLSELETDIEDNVALYVLGRPFTYLAAMYAVGMMVPGKRLTLPQYLLIAMAGAGSGSFVRGNFTNPAATNPYD